MGFEPTISCVTGRRALQAAPRGRSLFSVAQVGFEPTASLVLCRGGLPIAYRAACAQTRIRTSNRAGLSRAALPVGVPGQSLVVPDGVEPSFPVCRTGVVAVGPRDYSLKWTHWESHPDLQRAELMSSCWTMSPPRRKLDHGCAAVPDSNPQVACATDCFQDSVLIRPDDLRLSCGSWNRTNIKTFRASHPTVRRSRNCCLVPGVGIEPTDSWFKARHHYQQRRPRNVYLHLKVPCGS